MRTAITNLTVETDPNDFARSFDSGSSFKTDTLQGYLNLSTDQSLQMGGRKDTRDGRASQP